jgi:hypothetical protein
VSASTSAAGSGAPLQANIEAPAAAGGFAIRLHKGLSLKVTVPPNAATASQQLSFALSPSGGGVLTPLPNAPAGYYKGAKDGTVTVNVTAKPKCASGSPCPAHVTVVGKLTVTVWG